MSVNIDFTGIGEVPPEAEYTARIEDAEQTLSKASNQPMIKVSYKIVGTEHDGFPLFDNFSLTPQALWKLQDFLTILTGERPEGPISLDLQDWMGREVNVIIGHEDYNGKPTAKIQTYVGIEPF
jgi:hypothetical protein